MWPLALRAKVARHVDALWDEMLTRAESAPQRGRGRETKAWSKRHTGNYPLVPAFVLFVFLFVYYIVNGPRVVCCNVATLA